jgi:hypothetical protein
MPKFELIQPIEARQLNPRTGIQTSDPPVTIPFGAIIEDVIEDRDARRFSYLGQPYRCEEEDLRRAAVAVAAPAWTSPQPRQPQTETAAPTAAAAQVATRLPAPEEPAGEQPTVFWERLASNGKDLMRVRVPGGWLVALADGNASPSFFPDPEHRWR